MDTKADSVVSVNIYNSESGLDVAKEIVRASLKAACSMGFLDANDVELDVKVHTTLRRKK